MPLRTGAAELFGTFVVFPMRNGDQTIAVHVSAEALQQLDSGNRISPLGQCETYRARLEAIASTKFDRGQIEANETIRIRITTDDLMLS
jgi:hypothetical protein